MRSDMRPVEVMTGKALARLVRDTPLRYNGRLKPYKDSEITLEPLAIDSVAPLAKYVLYANLEELSGVAKDLERAGVDLFQLHGRLTLEVDQEQRFLSPPVVEEWPEEGYLLVDGLHRAWLAREEGRNALNCLVIRRVSLPLVPLPVDWSEICVYEQGTQPREEEKRLYRFRTQEDILDYMGEVPSGLNSGNAKYFFFRDLSALGSAGIRQFPDRTSNGA